MVDVLFSLGDWKIRQRQYQDQDHTVLALDTWVAHECTDPWRRESDTLSWFVADGSMGVYGCFYCGEPVPNEVQGLLLLLVAGI